jgi:hypothetical protein
MKRMLVIGMIMLALVFPGAACASPLYGGYNGESEAWFEVYIVESADILFSLRISIGFDSDLTHLWVRAGISSLFLAPFNISSVGISYETGNIISASLDAILPWPFQVGADTNNLVWGVTSFLVGVSGSDSDGNVWVEAGVPGVTACGEVNQENGWCWVKILPVLLGTRVDLPSDRAISFSKENYRKYEDEFTTLRDYFAGEYSPQFYWMLREKLAGEEVMEKLGILSEAVNSRAVFPLAALPIQESERGFDALGAPTTELNALLRYVEEEIFTGAIKEEMDIFLDDFAREMKPRLEAIKKSGE